MQIVQRHVNGLQAVQLAVDLVQKLLGLLYGGEIPWPFSVLLDALGLFAVAVLQFADAVSAVGSAPDAALLTLADLPAIIAQDRAVRELSMAFHADHVLHLRFAFQCLKSATEHGSGALRCFAFPTVPRYDKRKRCQ